MRQNPFDGDIILENVSKAYGPQKVLVDFSARLPTGAAVALTGPSGSGKTTLARIIMGLEKPDAGRLLGTVALRFGCVFQEDRLCEHLNAEANVALVLPRAEFGAVPAALSALGLTGTLCQKPVAELSGGERRRVALARAVLAPGQVLVLDEAFKGLDSEARKDAFAFIKQNLRGRSLLLITHDEAEAKAFDAEMIQIVKQPQPAAAPG